MQSIDILRRAVEMRVSDLHLISNCPPMVRMDGQLIPMPGFPALSSEQCGQFILSMLTDAQRQRLEQEWTLDFSLTVDEARFRGNVLFQRHGMECILRLIADQIPSPEDLLLPPAVVQLTELRRGLVLVTGPTGSGKTTTLASLINVINARRRANIITIEDPIEFLYNNQASVVSQREIGQHAPNFSSALKYVLRQDPDVVLIGELRDYETIAAALTVAETGHLVFGTLHTIDAAQSVDRIIDVFPSRQQQQVRTQLAGTLKAVISQILVQRTNGRGRVAARELMFVSPAIANLIRQGKTHEIYSHIEMGSGQGMIGLDRALQELVKKGLIDQAEALGKSNNPDASARQGQMLRQVI
jgi:twitching motility protein PilT